MRILHTADWHLGKNLEGQSRMDEQEQFLNDFVDIVQENNIDLIMIAGDIYDNPNPPARAEKMFYDTLKRISKNGERLTLVISGNHDNPDRLVAAGPLARDHGIIMVGTPKTVVPCGQYGKHKVLDSGEGFIEIEVNGERSVILTVPYPSEKRLNEVLYDGMDEEEEKVKSYSDRIFLLFNSLKQHYREDTINLAIAHLFTMGSEEGGSERSIQLGGSYIVDGECFPKESQYVALGHVHKPQVVPGTQKRIRYCGSPIHYNKKEISFEKKCFIVDAKVNEECEIREISLKVYKPIEVWKCNSIEEAILMCEENKDKECWVYLEVKTDRYIREDEIKQMKEFKKDILEIMPKVKGLSMDDSEGLNLSEKSFEDIFKEFYEKERKVEPDEEVVDLLLSIVSEESALDETN
ncbi:exonuclease SbcCD subunit D [Clostridium saccharobutylicum]|uniref:Nuclease SbcCD subunit D n=1 Tax=Clostridium saccharobutylicum DSM 13864 TaxID=1345695 RepID=U5MNX7_CLOSA|nr:exonuclease SbcCD subunit D [Clostridium saccharobutylicum]AGX42228.1 nuclease SbcCD subunit D [Clostridium saccharobutylicum DSM 13864]AQR89508.1 nuclease SbcCD subunit D [Clostridium saccharobutylicum]AQR99410.1 nuclease SbcCD subunit D [Clostridium saccharobutylicum]AQS09141.1 nuclease SbcCD subunit D [Clostridium saccharobutylicum]AQS13396.1 nuclease SbcCD subunit D [Clostridium saccharobutylicum]